MNTYIAKCIETRQNMKQLWSRGKKTPGVNFKMVIASVKTLIAKQTISPIEAFKHTSRYRRLFLKLSSEGDRDLVTHSTGAIYVHRVRVQEVAEDQEEDGFTTLKILQHWRSTTQHKIQETGVREENWSIETPNPLTLYVDRNLSWCA